MWTAAPIGLEYEIRTYANLDMYEEAANKRGLEGWRVACTTFHPQGTSMVVTFERPIKKEKA